MIEIDKPKIEIVDLSTQGSRSVGKFVVEPLERGFGATLGNGMRRVLLSSLPGYAITSVKIDGVLHEFSTIPHVKEDVTEIVLNLKNVILKIHDEQPKMLHIEASGEGEITAGDIIHDADVEILNPELHIAYLDAGADACFITFPGSIRGMKEWRHRIHGPVVTTPIKYEDSIDQETEAGACMSVYWPNTIYAAFTAVRDTLKKFAETRDMTKVDAKFDEDELLKLLPLQKYYDQMDKYHGEKQYLK